MAAGRSRDTSERLNFQQKCTIKVVEKYEGMYNSLQNPQSLCCGRFAG